MSPETIQNDGPNGIYSYPLGQYANTDATSRYRPLRRGCQRPQPRHTSSAQWSTRPSLPRPSTKTLPTEYGKIVIGNYSLWSQPDHLLGHAAPTCTAPPYNARNHEYYSEDAVLTSGQAVAFMQRRQWNTALSLPPSILPSTIPKSTVLGVSVFMTEQQARENELRGTQGMPSRTLGALGVMTAFNRVGITAGQRPHRSAQEHPARRVGLPRVWRAEDFIHEPQLRCAEGGYALNGGTMSHLHR